MATDQLENVAGSAEPVFWPATCVEGFPAYLLKLCGTCSSVFALEPWLGRASGHFRPFTLQTFLLDVGRFFWGSSTCWLGLQRGG